MHTEHLHRTLSPQAYARLQDHLRQQAECEHRLAVQTFFQTFALALLRPLSPIAQRLRHPQTRSHAIEAA
jgi:hypothetical protein